MALKFYETYGAASVRDAQKQYDNIANKPPTYKDSVLTTGTRQNADYYAKKYQQANDAGYHSQYSKQINELADKYANDRFEWDKDGSSEYGAYKDYYRREGQRQQENIQQSYAANSDGYSNTYAQAAGQRAYNQYMDELASKIPALRNSALADWSQQQEQRLNQISLLRGFDDSAYAQYRDRVSDLYDFMTYYENKYSTLKGLDMSQYQAELSNWQARISASMSNLANIRSLSESQRQHNTTSADTAAQLRQNKAQFDETMKYNYSKIK